MKRKYLFAAIAVLLAAGGLWFARSAKHSEPSASHKSNAGVEVRIQNERPTPGLTQDQRPRLAPPDQARRFMDFTPEQRVEFARKGHGPGG